MHLKTNIHQMMAVIPPNMYQKVVENHLKRSNSCNTAHGSHLNDVVSVSHIMSTWKSFNKKEISWKKIFIRVLFTFAFETTKWITQYFGSKMTEFLPFVPVLLATFCIGNDISKSLLCCIKPVSPINCWNIFCPNKTFFIWSLMFLSESERNYFLRTTLSAN